jgi:small redox-active disulfide protein 2
MPDYKEPKISQISVDGHRIGMRNVDKAFENVRSRGTSKETDLKRALIEEMRAMKNYIPDSAEARYEKALLREYRRSLGEHVEEDEPEGLVIKVLGMGCPNCDRLTEEVMAALSDLHLGADVEHVTDLNQIDEYGALGTPALVINKKIRSVGRVPKRDEIRNWLKAETNKEKNQ